MVDGGILHRHQGLEAQHVVIRLHGQGILAAGHDHAVAAQVADKLLLLASGAADRALRIHNHVQAHEGADLAAG